MKYTNKEKALYEYLDIWKEDTIEEIFTNTYRTGGAEYLICTDEEADEMVKGSISETVWAFVPGFIIDHSSILDYDNEDMLIKLQEQCENSNEVIKKLIDDFDEFVDDAIGTDGRGHFLSQYDGKEHEVEYKGVTYYIYRLN